MAVGLPPLYPGRLSLLWLSSLVCMVVPPPDLPHHRMPLMFYYLLRLFPGETLTKCRSVGCTNS